MLSRYMKAGWMVVLVGLVLVPMPSQAVFYYGSLSYPTGLDALGHWATTIGQASTLSWRVTETSTPGWWTYRYELSHPPGKTERLILETSLDLSSGDIANVRVNDAGGSLVPYLLMPGDIPTPGPGEGNDGMPGDIHGILFNRGIRGIVTTIEFDSRWMPAWGDFYAKGDGFPTVDATWNSGFTAADPLDPIGDGSTKYHVLVPAALVEPIPEPATLLLLGTGLLAAAGLRRKRN